MTGPFLQTATGGSTAVVLTTLIGLAVATVLSVIVAYRLVQGYRRSRVRAQLYLAAGLVLLTTGPILLRLVLTNLGAVSTVERALAATISELLGLLSILYAIYGTPESRRESDHRQPSMQSDQGER